jgi:hypothetical protein
LTAGDRARKEIRLAARRASEATEELRQLSDEMVSAGVSADLDCQEAVEEAANRLRRLSESLAA